MNISRIWTPIRVHGIHQSNNQKDKGLLDPKHMSVPVFDAKGREKYTDWRETFEVMVNEVHVGLMSVLKKIHNDKSRVTEARIKEVVEDLELEGETVNLDYKRVNFELSAYLLGQIDGKQMLKAESIKLAGGIEMKRILSQKYDRVSDDHEALLTAEISKMAPTQASNVKDLGNQMLVFESKIEAFQTRLGK